jgi:2-oxoglutarate ferredoxin oxidoreductase subunit beta
MLASGATYIARGYTKKMQQLESLIRGGIAHRGFAFIDVLQICATFFPVADYYSQRVYDHEDYDLTDFSRACAKAREWDYSSDAKIALGIFYEQNLPTFDEKMAVVPSPAGEREQRILDLLATRT